MDKQSNEKSSKKILVGEVVSKTGDKTVSVDVSHIKSHPVYKKHYAVNRKHIVHDENNEYKVGDKIEIVEDKPHSKKKKWKVLRKVK